MDRNGREWTKVDPNGRTPLSFFVHFRPFLSMSTYMFTASSGIKLLIASFCLINSLKICIINYTFKIVLKLRIPMSSILCDSYPSSLTSWAINHAQQLNQRHRSCFAGYVTTLATSVALPILASLDIFKASYTCIRSICSSTCCANLKMLLHTILLAIQTPFLLIANLFGADMLPVVRLPPPPPEAVNEFIQFHQQVKAAVARYESGGNLSELVALRRNYWVWIYCDIGEEMTERDYMAILLARQDNLEYQQIVTAFLRNEVPPELTASRKRIFDHVNSLEYDFGFVQHPTKPGRILLNTSVRKIIRQLLYLMDPNDIEQQNVIKKRLREQLPVANGELILDTIKYIRQTNNYGFAGEVTHFITGGRGTRPAQPPITEDPPIPEEPPLFIIEPLKKPHALSEQSAHVKRNYKHAAEEFEKLLGEIARSIDRPLEGAGFPTALVELTKSFL